MSKSKWPDVQSKLVLVEAWARDGLTDDAIAQKLGISESTLNNYKKDHLEFLESLKRGKEVIDVEVENALLKRAIGYKFDEVTKEAKYNPDSGEYELGITKTVTKEVQPDVTAQIFWLKNRKPVEWRDKQSVEVSGELNNPYAGLTTEELKKLINDD